MELEFDKEMNAILRKAGRQGSAVAAVSTHVDADTIAAFAENALPANAWPPLIEHFSACDNCRQALSQTILLNAEAGATAASSVIQDPAVEISVPWWRKLFSTPGLALAMGALVVMFTGVLGYIALHNRSAANADVSQIKEPEQTRGGPYDSGASEPAANTAPNVMPMSNAAMSSNTAVMSSNSAANSAIARKEDAGQPKTAAAPADNGFVLDGVTSSKPGEPAPAAGAPAPPPPPVTTAMATTEAEKKKEDTDKLAERGRDADTSKDRENDDRRGYRDAPLAAAKSGPARSGPYQMKSNQAGNGVFDMSVKRTVGGKTFNNRDGAWYDSAYHGQSTIDIRRGTNEFKKLDGGLKSIANNIGGVVVVVWKSKAYRIQ